MLLRRQDKGPTEPGPAGTTRAARILTSGADEYGGAMDVRRTPTRRRRAETVIASPARHTVMDDGGAVRSVQVALIRLPHAALEAMWSPMYMERLARTYWKFLSRATLGLVRVSYSAGDRAVVLIGRPVVLLRFAPPEYMLTRDGGIVRWRIRSGLLVARPGHDVGGFLELEVRRRPSTDAEYAQVEVRVEVANFYPALASWLTRGFYKATQSQIHVLVTHGFLRSLSSLELERSAVGRFDPMPVDVPPDTPRRVEAGHWLAAALLLAAAATAGVFLRRRLQAWRRPTRSRSLVRSWRAWMRRTVPEAVRITSDSVVAPREPS